MARPTFNSADPIQSDNFTTTSVVTKPAAAVAGKLWGVLISMATARTVTPPAGWTLVGSGASRVFLYVRPCDGTEGSTATFTYSGSTNARAIPFVFNNVDMIAPITVSGAWNNPGSAGASNAAPGITDPGDANSVLISVIAVIGNPTVVTKPGTMTQQFQDNSPTTFALAMENSVAGATGTRTWTWTSNFSTAAMNFVLKGVVDVQSEFMGILKP